MFDNNEEWTKRIETLHKCNYERAGSFEEEFQNCELVLIKKAEKKKDKILLICVVKNDLLRIKKFIDHYRKLGIKSFIFLDNGSTDGTFEYLMSQNDCEIYQSTDCYSSLRRVVWINKLISYYGCGFWYVVVDSDEFILYQGLEKISISDLIKYADSKGIYRISGFLLDMYSKGSLFRLEKNEDFIKEYRYFDKKGYDIHNTNYGVSIIGGPRKRKFGTFNELAKCPIFKLNQDDIVASSHFLLPRIMSRYNPIWILIGHYKFINFNDIHKINDAVKNENYASGSVEYKAYQKEIQRSRTIVFYDEKISAELIDSNIFEELPYVNFPIGDLYEQK